MLRERPVVLRDLVALREIGIEVVFPREDRSRIDVEIEREGCARRHFDHPSIQDRKRARQPQADGARIGVGLVAEPSRASAEYLGFGLELRVDLEAYDGFVLVSHGTRNQQDFRIVQYNKSN